MYYKTFQEILGEPFLETFNALQDSPPIHPSMYPAHISVIPKQGKDNEQAGTNRPILLLNVSLKIFTKIIAGRLVGLLKINTLSSSGFPAGQRGEGWDNKSNRYYL